MSANEIRIPVAIPDDHEFVRFDPEKGEAVYKKKVLDFAIRRVPRGEEFYFAGSSGEVIANIDLRALTSNTLAATYNYDIDKARCERRAKREAARRKMEYIADRLNPEGWSWASNNSGWCIVFRLDSLRFEVFKRSIGVGFAFDVSETYFYSKEAAETALAAMSVEELHSLSLQPLSR